MKLKQAKFDLIKLFFSQVDFFMARGWIFAVSTGSSAHKTDHSIDPTSKANGINYPQILHKFQL